MVHHETFPAERTAVLTGAASPRGIGRATAEMLASAGWSVAILDVDGDAARKAAEEIAAVYGVQAVGVGADVSDQAAVNAAIDEVESSLPPIVGLANLAGISSPTEFMDETLEAWERVFKINMTGTFLVTQRVLRGMIDRRLGRIVSVSSISAQRGGGTYSKVAYSASKAAIIGFTLTDERKAAMSADILVGRVGTVRDIAALMVFLMGEDAGYITAATYDINGGLQIS